MAANPDPARITDALWHFWEESAKVIPGVRLGGIYADKVCYHNTVQANKRKWPDAYCIQQPLDLDSGPQDKARAIDLTMSTAEMIKRTSYMRRAALHPEDNRLGAFREFYGTLDGVTVYGLIREADGTWVSSTADSTHLWHLHGSIYTAYCANWAAIAPGISVLAGVTWDDWQEGNDVTVYYRISAPGTEWDAQVYISNGVNRRGPIRPPGAIRNAAIRDPGYKEIILTEAQRASVSAAETWENFLTAVAGPPAIGMPDQLVPHTHGVSVTGTTTVHLVGDLSGPLTGSGKTGPAIP